MRLIKATVIDLMRELSDDDPTAAMQCSINKTKGWRCVAEEGSGILTQGK
jgi:hypothetical protein